MPCVGLRVCAPVGRKLNFATGKTRRLLLKLLIHIAPEPALVGLRGGDDRMTGGAEMLGRVLVFRRIATSHVSAVQALTQVNPTVPGFEAFLATIV